MNNQRMIRILRWLILAAVTASVTAAAWAHQVYGGAKAASIHALCPFGGLESLYAFVMGGNMISKIFTGTMLLFAITVVLALVFRRSFCGLLCPFGALQELFAAVGKKLLGRRLEMPYSIDRPLRYLKYGVLLLTVGYAWKTAGLWMAPYDPWAAYGHLFSNDLAGSFAAAVEEMPIGLGLLAVTVVGSLLYDRFFCKYLCPMGAFYGLLGKISTYRVVREPDVCVNCGACSRVCPVNIDVQHGTEVRSAECLDCQLCTLQCPKAGALSHRIGKKNLKPFMALLLVMALFWGSVVVLQASGLYELLPEKPAAGTIIPLEEVKGYMTLKEASEATGMELGALYEKMGIPKSVPPETMLKEVGGLVEGFDLHKAKGE